VAVCIKRRKETMELQFDAKIFISFALLGFFGLLVRLYNSLVVKPKRLRSVLRKQGINGPVPTLLLGNIKEIKKAQSTTVKAPTTEPPVSHNCAATLFPFFEQWRRQYGTCFIHQYHVIIMLLSTLPPPHTHTFSKVIDKIINKFFNFFFICLNDVRDMKIFTT
jgi:hypothetical protein